MRKYFVLGVGDTTDFSFDMIPSKYELNIADTDIFAQEWNASISLLYFYSVSAVISSLSQVTDNVKTSSA